MIIVYMKIEKNAREITKKPKFLEMEYFFRFIFCILLMTKL